MLHIRDDTRALRIDHLHGADDLHVWLHEGGSDRLVLCFAGIGGTPSIVPPIEFPRAASRNGEDTVLFFSDPQRSWLNAPGLIEQIVAWVERYTHKIGARQVVALGHSMGGFMAAVMSGFTKIDVAMCFSPQACVHPQWARDEKRWAEWRDRITDFRIRAVGDHLDDDTTCYAMFGRHPREAPQRERFPIRKNVHFFVFPNTVHNTPQRLKQAGVLDDVVRYAFHGRRGLVERVLTEKLNAERWNSPTKAMRLRAKDDAAAQEAAPRGEIR